MNAPKLHSPLPPAGRARPGAEKGLSVRHMQVRFGQPLEIVVDPAERVAAVPKHHLVKGMFLAELVRHLGPKWPSVAATLVAPPRLGRYLPFGDYPRVDHIRLLYAVALARYPHATPAQGVRLTGRRDAQIFNDSLVGKALLAPISSVKGALLRGPRAYQLVVRGGTVRALDLGERWVRLEYRDFAGWVEGATIGLVEGMVGAFGAQASIDIEFLSDADANYDVRW
ncbi:MAG TPA: DUF2378 family protein [Polyangiaceae bacterium]|nr:DUF2378 family protein [Polyangiaceae bacterium]